MSTPTAPTAPTPPRRPHRSPLHKGARVVMLERLRDQHLHALKALPTTQWLQEVTAIYERQIAHIEATSPLIAQELRAHLKGHAGREEAARAPSTELVEADRILCERYLPLPPSEFYRRTPELLRELVYEIFRCTRWEFLPEPFQRRYRSSHAPEQHARYKKRVAPMLRRRLKRNIQGEITERIQSARAETLKGLCEALARYERVKRGVSALFGEQSGRVLSELSGLSALSEAVGGGQGSQRGRLHLTPLYELISSAEVEGLVATLGRATGERREGERRTQRAQRRGSREEWRPSPLAREEFTGVQTGRDLGLLLPSEYALLSAPQGAADAEEDELLELLFYQRLAEGTLNIYEPEGVERASVEVSREVEAPLPASSVDERGPFVICIDSSGSMSGARERLAKAITLAALRVALREQRRCFLVNFSTQLACAELSPDGVNLGELLAVVSGSFHGGTDIGVALHRACAQLEEREYTFADVLVVSDFDYPSVPDDAITRVEARRALGARFKAAPVVRSYCLPVLKFYDEVLPLADYGWDAWCRPFGGI